MSSQPSSNDSRSLRLAHARRRVRPRKQRSRSRTLCINKQVHSTPRVSHLQTRRKCDIIRHLALRQATSLTVLVSPMARPSNERALSPPACSYARFAVSLTAHEPRYPACRGGEQGRTRSESVEISSASCFKSTSSTVQDYSTKIVKSGFTWRLQESRDLVLILSWDVRQEPLVVSIFPHRTAIWYLLPLARDRRRIH